MRRYDFKRGHRKSEGDIEAIMRELFGNVNLENGKLNSEYKGLEKITVWIDNKKLAVETRPRNVSDAEAIDTLKIWNEFLYRVTGYTSKERKKKMSKS